MNLRQLVPSRIRSFEIFNGLFDYGTGALRSGFYPVQLGGMSSPPVNIARTDTGDFITPKRALELSTVWSCVWLIADTISSLPFILNQREGNNTWGVPAFEDPLFAVVGCQPNQYMTQVDYWKFMVASQMLWGNAYSLKTLNGNGDCIALATLLPQFMVPYKQIATGELRYKYFPGGLTNEPMADYGYDEIFHMKDHSLDGITGLSRVEYGRNSMGIARAAERQTSDVYKNGMRSGGFLSVDKTLKQEQRDQLEQSLDKFKTSQEKSGAIMILEAGMSFGALTMKPQDVELLSTRQYSVEDVCRWFGVPPVMVGHSGQGVTMFGSGVENLLTAFKSLSLRPIIRGIEAQVLRQLVPAKKRPQRYLTIDTDDLLGADSVARSLCGQAPVRTAG